MLVFYGYAGTHLGKIQDEEGVEQLLEGAGEKGIGKMSTCCTTQVRNSKKERTLNKDEKEGLVYNQIFLPLV